MFIRATQHDFCRVRNFCFDVVGHRHDDGMAKAELHVEPHSAHSYALASGILFEGGTISNSDEIKRHGKALGHAGDCILDERASETPHGALLLELRILDAEGHGARSGETQGHVRLEWD